MKRIVLAALLAGAGLSVAPPAQALCAESHGREVHVHSQQCGTESVASILQLCMLLPDVHTPVVGFTCD